MKSNITVGVTTVAFSKNQALVENLRSIGFARVKINEEGVRFSKEMLVDYLKDCDAAIVGLDKITDEVLSELPKLKLISKYGVGLDNIDFNACEKHNVKVVYTQGVNRRSVSEMALGFMLMLLRNLYVTSNQLKNGQWNKSGGVQLSGKKIGVIGIGNIGKDLIELLKPFGCEIYANDIVDIEDYCKKQHLRCASKEEIYRNCDIITMHTPLTDDTKYLMNANSISQCKPGVIILNTARGGIVNQIDLKEALLSGKVGGAAMDAYEEEPPSDMDLISIPNFIGTPHIGGNAKEAILAMGQSAIDNLVNYFV